MESFKKETIEEIFNPERIARLVEIRDRVFRLKKFGLYIERLADFEDKHPDTKKYLAFHVATGSGITPERFMKTGMLAFDMPGDVIQNHAKKLLLEFEAESAGGRP